MAKFDAKIVRTNSSQLFKDEAVPEGHIAVFVVDNGIFRSATDDETQIRNLTFDGGMSGSVARFALPEQFVKAAKLAEEAAPPARPVEAPLVSREPLIVKL